MDAQAMVNGKDHSLIACPSNLAKLIKPLIAEYARLQRHEAAFGAPLSRDRSARSSAFRQSPTSSSNGQEGDWVALGEASPGMVTCSIVDNSKLLGALENVGGMDHPSADEPPAQPNASSITAVDNAQNEMESGGVLVKDFLPAPKPPKVERLALEDGNLRSFAGALKNDVASPDASSNLDGALGFLRLSKTLPPKLELREVWSQHWDVQVLRTTTPCSGQTESLSEQLYRNRESGVHGSEKRSSNCMQCFVLRPDTVWMLVWHVFSFLFICWDTVFLPMQTFSLPAREFRERVDLVIAIFWVCDMIMAFFVGFWNEQYMEMRPGRVAKAYLTSWFPLDITMVSLDLFVILMKPGVFDVLSIVRSIKAVRVLRWTKMLRLLRLAKVATQLNHIRDYIMSEYMLTMIRVTKMVLAVLALSHFIACAWYELGTWEAFEATWLVNLERLNDKRSGHWAFRYSTALHWALTQFTPGSMEVVPTNEAERAFTIVVILLALIIFSSILSTITSAMTHLRIMKTEQFQQGYKMRSYFKQNSISIGLSNSINKYLRAQTAASKRRLQEHDVVLLSRIPDSLRLALRVEARLPTLLPHPLFQQISTHSPEATRQICDKGLQEVCSSAEDAVLTVGKVAERMFFVRSFGMRYECDGCATMDLQFGEGIAEMVLWVHWTYRGRLCAANYCDVFALDATTFQSIVVGSDVLMQCCVYGRLLCRALCDMDDDPQHPLTDVLRNRRLQQQLVTNAFADIPSQPSSPKPLLRRKLFGARSFSFDSVGSFGNGLEVATVEQRL